MPVTWLAHQTPVLPLKLIRPRWFDATALCVGSMVPDSMYAFSRLADIDTHRWPAATGGFFVAQIQRVALGVYAGLLLGAAVTWRSTAAARRPRPVVDAPLR